MARLARVVAAGVPHHVMQRGIGRRHVFSSDADYAAYRALLAAHCKAAGVTVLAYCLLPTQVHLILVPRDPDGLRAALGETHRRYARHVNARAGRRGLLWRGRFASFPLDEKYLLASARYMELAPVRAKLARRARDWRWSSARAHLAGRDDGLVTVRPLRALARGWANFLREGSSREEERALRAGEGTGRPLGSPDFVKRLEQRLKRTLARRKPGPKPRKRKGAG